MTIYVIFQEIYDKGLLNVHKLLNHLVGYISNLYYDNRRMASYVRGQLD